VHISPNYRFDGWMIDFKSDEKRTNNRISLFAVSEKWRGKSVGKRLLKTALRQLDHTKAVTVDTYREGYVPGIPARSLYRKYGFVETDSNIINPHGQPDCRMTADLSNEKRGGSFHYQYPSFIKTSNSENCPCKTNPNRWQTNRI
jgi:predicted N-acetyltransferase YhbS